MPTKGVEQAWLLGAACSLSGATKRGLQVANRLGYTRRLFRKFYLRVSPAMEINPILNSIKDLSERSQTIRGYL